MKKSANAVVLSGSGVPRQGLIPPSGLIQSIDGFEKPETYIPFMNDEIFSNKHYGDELYDTPCQLICRVFFVSFFKNR